MSPMEEGVTEALISLLQAQNAAMSEIARALAQSETYTSADSDALLKMLNKIARQARSTRKFLGEFSPRAMKLSAPSSDREDSEANLDSYNPVSVYRPYFLRALLEMKDGATLSDIRKRMLQFMKSERTLKPADSEYTGRAPVRRYVSQSNAVLRSLQRRGMVSGDGTRGYMLTDQGLTFARETLGHRAQVVETHRDTEVAVES